MTSVDDIQGYGRKFRNQLSKLADADIDSRDRDAIERFIRHEDAQDDVNTGTMVSHINRLRLSAERADVALVDMEIDDVDIFLSRLKREFDLAQGTRRNYRKALRVFFRYLERDWADDIRIGASPKRTVDRSELLTDDDVNALLQAASNGKVSGVRDKALIALLDDTGLRIGAIGSLRVRDVDMSERVATISINEEANVKDASGTKPLTYSRGYVANWLEVHPRSDEPDAALIHKTEQLGEDDDGALRQQYLSRRIKDIGADAGLDPGRVHSHLFRKTAISRWIRDDVHEQVIKNRVDWAKDSQQFETYSGVMEEEHNEQFLEHYDLADPSEERSRKIEKCTICGTALRGGEVFCHACGAPLDGTAAELNEQLDSGTRRFMRDEGDPERRATADEIVDVVKSDPELAQRLSERLGEIAGDE